MQMGHVLSALSVPMWIALFLSITFPTPSKHFYFHPSYTEKAFSGRNEEQTLLNTYILHHLPQYKLVKTQC